MPRKSGPANKARPAVNREFQRQLKERKRLRRICAEEHREMMRDYLSTLPVSALQGRAKRFNVSLRGATRKAEMIERLAA